MENQANTVPSSAQSTKPAKPSKPDARQSTIPGSELPVTETPKATLTPEQMKTMSVAFLAAHGKVEKLEADLAIARAEKSETVRVIVEAAGHKGPFRIGGKQFVAAKSKGEGSTGYSMRETSEVKLDFGA